MTLGIVITIIFSLVTLVVHLLMSQKIVFSLVYVMTFVKWGVSDSWIRTAISARMLRVSNSVELCPVCSLINYSKNR